MKNILCLILGNHMRIVRSTEDLSGQEFRYVSSCKCGKNVIKSVPLHDNDLLSNINLHHMNFPIDKNA